MFGVALYSEVDTIITAGIKTALLSFEEIESCLMFTCESELTVNLKLGQHQILIVTLRDSSNSDAHYNLIRNVKEQFPRQRIIAVASKISKDMVFRAVKFGANGFLSSDASLKELREAVYTIRAGHEYFSSSITNLLVNNYVEAMRTEPVNQEKITDLLGKREIEVLSQWAEGYTNAEIAEKLFISVRTVESHKNHIMQKLGIRTTVDLIKFAIRNNIVEL